MKMILRSTGLAVILLTVSLGTKTAQGATAAQAGPTSPRVSSTCSKCRWCAAADSRSAMTPARLTAYNVAGAVLWIASLTYAGYFFGNIPWVKQNLSFIIVGILGVSVIPLAVAMWRARSGR